MPYSILIRGVRLTSFLLAMVTADVWAGGVQVSEIMYHPPSTNRLEEWFEVHNSGANPADVSRWKVTQGVNFIFPSNTVVKPDGYLVVAADLGTFGAGHPDITNVIGGWQGSLSHDGEEIRIEDAKGNVINRVAYAPEGDWAVRRIGPLDRLNRQGWEWLAEHDGLGRTLELVNPELPIDLGQNWGPSRALGGTPGKPNSILNSNLAPIILDVVHAPAVPRSTDPVRVTARIVDEGSSGPVVGLHWRVDGTSGFTTTPMLDDGVHGDGTATDGLFGALVAPHASGTIIEFYLTAQDSTGQVRTYPNVQAANGGRTANLAFQVDDASYAGAQPLLRLIMTKAEYEYLSAQIWSGEAYSDAAVNGTFISTDGVLDGGTTTQVRYACAIRNRGHGTRTAVPHNFHVGFPKDSPWKGRFGLNLNTHYTHSQELGSAIFRRVGIPMADSRPVQVRVNGAQLAKPSQEQFGSYAANELVDDRMLQRQFALDPGGNLYRGIRDMIPGISANADLVWHGPLYSSYTSAYAKENNGAANDWSDLIHLIDVLNHSPEATYSEAVNQVVDVDAWMKYFAVNTLLDNQENSLGIGEGDDFALYRGLQDRRFRLLPYDMDSVMGRGLRDTTYGDGIWRMTKLPIIDRFIKRPDFVHRYFRHLIELADTTFAGAQMNPLIDELLSGYVDVGTLSNLKAFNSNHIGYVLAQIPRALSITHSLPVVSGFARANASRISLSGNANPVVTRRVLVGGVPAQWTAWQAAWTNPIVNLHPGVNRLLVQAMGEGEVEVGRATLDVWFDDGSVQTAGETLTGSSTWTSAGGPYSITSDLTIAPGSSLTVEAGTTVYLGSGVNLVIASGGRLIAEGSENAPIRFSTLPGATTSWGGVIIKGGAGTPETRISYAHFDGNGTTCIEVAGGTLQLDHATFGRTSHPYISLDASSFLISHCHFPATTAGFEPMHGTGGIKSGGRGIIRDSYFGSSMGYNDIVDFTGGNRPGQPIIQFFNNVFEGATDDILDLDGTDAWIEGNIFLHVHRNGAPDSSAAISGGNSGGSTSELTIMGNLFFDCDNAVTAKQGNFYTLLNNTIVRVTKNGGLDFASGVINVRDTTPDVTTFGRGAYVEGNIISDAEQLVRNYDSQQTTVTFVNNILPYRWNGPGSGNWVVDPLFLHVPRVEEAIFGNWRQAQILRTWLSLQPGSPASARGPNGRDLGGVVPPGVSIAGAPSGVTSTAEAFLSVGILRKGSGIPVPGFPEGSGFPHYRWRLDGGEWSVETPASAAIELTNLADGAHHVDVVGKNDAGLYQNDPALGTNATITSTTVWTVDRGYVPPPSAPTIRINEILDSNVGQLIDLGTTPDLIELFNFGTASVDLSGMGLTDSASEPYRFTFPAGMMLPAGAYLVLRAEDSVGGGGLSTGFKLNGTGDEVALFERANRGGGLLDFVRFGVQVADSSIGRLSGSVWGLCRPTFGAENEPRSLGDARSLRINEWLSDAQFVASHDFIELYNTDSRPVAMGGLFLSDSSGAPARHAIPALSFIDGHGYAEFIADGQAAQGADHLGFKISPEVGLILLSSAELTTLDAINYSAQRTDVSRGRSPNGADTFAFFVNPTPGGGNPGVAQGGCTLATTTVNLVAPEATWRYDQTRNLDGTGWYLPGYDDSAWPSGPALLGVESSALPAPGRQTTLALGRTTYYFRTHFVVDTNLAGFNLNLKMVVDDGALLYLNGSPILTNGFNGSLPGYATFASRNVDNASTEFFTVPAAMLVQGTNVLAAEVHQVNSGSSDIVWGLAVDASRTYTNCASESVLNLALSEVLAASGVAATVAESPADFIELFNSGTNVVSLAGLSLSDDSRFPGKWVFPVGATIPPGGYLVIHCDGGQPQSSTNTGFGLEQTGGAVYLFNAAANGGDLIDAIQYGVQPPGFSIGRVAASGGIWNLTLPSPGAPNVLVGLGNSSTLRINEWMADPATGPDWCELYNQGSQPVALGGLYLTDNLGDPKLSPIAPLSFIGVGPTAFVKFIADGNSGAGASHLSFSLKKSGEEVGVFSATGTLLDGLSFGAQKTGISQGRFPDGAPSFASFPGTDSPGESNFLPLANLVISEVLTHTDPPLEDAIELYNPSDSPVAIGGWFLSNSARDLRKFRIPDGSTVPTHGYRVFYEGDFNRGPAAFTLNSERGDSVVLSQADALGSLTGYRAGVKFGPAENGISFGRIGTSVGSDFGPLNGRTFGEDNPSTVEEFRKGAGLPNAAPKIGSMVISEIMYSSGAGAGDRAEDEFLELQNISQASVPLYDPQHPTNTYSLRGAVDFVFPAGINVPPGARILIVGFPASDATLADAFRARYGVPAEVPILGAWNGRLANDQDSVELLKPDAVQLPPHPDAGLVPEVLVERVHYSAAAPWPLATSGGVYSLQRDPIAAYGNDPIHWRAAAPTAGRANTPDSRDSDDDGMDDTWESSYFGNLARDGTGDYDSDGMSDLQEFTAGTNPKEARDRLQFISIATGNSTALQFRGAAGRTYTVQYRSSLSAGAWVPLTNVGNLLVSGPVTVVDPAPADELRFYRVVTPALVP